MLLTAERIHKSLYESLINKLHIVNIMHERHYQCFLLLKKKWQDGLWHSYKCMLSFLNVLKMNQPIVGTWAYKQLSVQYVSFYIKYKLQQNKKQRQIRAYKMLINKVMRTIKAYFITCAILSQHQILHRNSSETKLIMEKLVNYYSMHHFAMASTPLNKLWFFGCYLFT